MISERNITIPKFPKSLTSKSSRSSPLQFESKKHKNSKSTVTLPVLQNTKPKKIQIQTPSDSKIQMLPSSPFKTQNSKGMFFLDGGEDFNAEEDFQKEYSCIENQIAIIRKKHDKTIEEINQSQLLLSRLQNELENFNFTEKQVNASQQQTQQSSESLKGKICELKDTYEEQLHLKNVYEHIYDRVKKEKIFFENKSKIISKKKDLQEYFLGIKSDKKRRQKEKKSQSLVSLKKVKQLLYVKRMQKENIIKKLELNLFERSQNKERRDLRIKNQTESIKKAMTDDKVSDEAQLKQKMLINRFYCI